MDKTILEQPRTEPQKLRRCLMCGTEFPSDGAHNRICRKCKTTATWREG